MACLGDEDDEVVEEDDIMLLVGGRPLCRLDMDMGEAEEIMLVLMVL